MLPAEFPGELPASPGSQGLPGVPQGSLDASTGFPWAPRGSQRLRGVPRGSPGTPRSFGEPQGPGEPQGAWGPNRYGNSEEFDVISGQILAQAVGAPEQNLRLFDH